MLPLTPAERRGAWTVVLILLIGAGYDLLRARAPLPVPSSDPVPASRSAPPADTLLSDPGTAPTSVRATPPDSGTRLDLNRATAAELDALPGIGPVLAGRIVAHREQHGGFRSVDELLTVPGIGPALYARLEPRVRI